jgi:predicted RNA-binding protein with PIN domain
VRPLLVVDGYNLLHADPGYVAAADIDIDEARRRLVDDVAVFAQGRYQAIVVFDGGGVAPHMPVWVSIEWSGAGEADTIVEALAFSARAEGRPCVVVTTDRATRDVVFGRGVDVVSSATMLEHLAISEAETREEGGRPRRITLGDRIDPATRATLERWAREGRPSR